MASFKVLKKIFTELVAEEHLGQGYIFFGPGARGGEAMEVAKGLASFLETTNWTPPEVLLDAEMLHGRNVGIDEIRRVIQFLWEKPVQSPRKTLIVEDADLMSYIAEPALLKVAEEPPAHGLIILTTKERDGLSAPLLSRFQKIYITGSEEKEIREEERARALLNAKTKKDRSDIIKEILEQEKMSEVMQALFQILHENTLKNAPLIRALLKRWTLMERFSTNQKLQIEAAFSEANQ